MIIVYFNNSFQLFIFILSKTFILVHVYAVLSFQTYRIIDASLLLHCILEVRGYAKARKQVFGVILPSSARSIAQRLPFLYFDGF